MAPGAWAVLAALAVSSSAGAEPFGPSSGARPAALGGAYSALVDDAWAPVWNPAALGFSDAPGLAISHAGSPAGARDDSASASAPLPGPQGLGLAGEDAGGLGKVYSLAYGRAAGRVALGAALRFRREEEGGRSTGVDLAGQYRWDERLTVAAVLGPSRSEGGPGLRLGASYRPRPYLDLDLEGILASSDRTGVRAGLELTALGWTALRAGLDTALTTASTPSRLGGLTAGLGLRVAGQELGYAWIPRAGGASLHQLSLVLRFGRPPSPAPTSVPRGERPLPSLLWLGGA